MKKRVLSMLLVLVMMVGLFPATAFAEEQQPCTTEGCEYILGHEGDCSNYVAPVENCPTEGCTYTANHEGNCSNYVAPAENCPTEGCTYTAGHEGNCSNFVACPVMGCLLAADHEGECKFVADEPVIEPSEDEKAAQAVIDLIAAIGEVSLESESAISAADTAYTALTDAQKALVTNLNVLEAAKAAYAALSVPAPAAYQGAVIYEYGVTDSSKVPNALGYFNRVLLDGVQNVNSVVWTGDTCEVLLDSSTAKDATITFVVELAGSRATNSNTRLTINSVGASADASDASIKIGSVTLESGEQTVNLMLSVMNSRKTKTIKLKVAEGGGATPTVPVEAITLDKDSLTLTAGTSETLTASVGPENATDKTVTWTSSDEAVAKVENGVVTAVAAGTATITAKAGEKTAACVVTVTAAEEPDTPPAETVPVSSVALNKTALELGVGNSETLTANVSPDNATDKTITWSSDNETVATVNQTGKVTAVAAGTATITAKAGEKTATCAVTVTATAEPPIVSVTDIILDKTTVSIAVGNTETLTAEVLPENATDKTVTWSSDNEEVATVDNGVVSAKTAGTATITAKAGEISATCEVTVTAPAPAQPTLSALKFSAGNKATSVEYALEPAFDPAVTEYTIVVPDDKNTLYAWATLGDYSGTKPEIQVVYNHPTTGIAKDPVTLTSKSTSGKSLSQAVLTGLTGNTLEVTLAGEIAYTVKIQRKAQLSKLTLSSNGSEAVLTPSFDKTKTEYDASVAWDSELTVEVTGGYKGSTFTINGETPTNIDTANKKASSSFVPQWKDMSSVVTIKIDGGEQARPTEYTIKLSQRAAAIAIAKQPDKTDYQPGEKFDPTGMTLLATYSDGSKKEVSPDAFSYPVEALTPGMTSVIIGYDGITVEQPITVSEAFAGSGTEDDPYLIKTADDLVKLSEQVASGVDFKGEFIKMVNDIELPSGWTPIGSGTDARFKGTFDGDGKRLTVPAGELPLFGYVGGATIKNLSIYGTQIAGYGLINNFDELDENALDKGVTISGITLKSGSSTLKSGLLGSEFTTNPYAGSTRFSEAHISGCTIESGVIIGYNADQSYIGSIAGRMQGSITGCTSNATVKGVNYVGGILGSRDNGLGNCSISGCSFGGSVVASGNQAGGILGGGYSGNGSNNEASAPNGDRTSVTGCTVTGSISGADKVGGIIGGDNFVAQTWSANQIKNNSFTGTISASGSYVGGIIGYYNSLNKLDDIANNYYSGASKGIGFVQYIDTNCTTHETASGAIYFDTGSDTKNCPDVFGCWWEKNHNRTDDPLGADKAKLCYTDADTEPVATELKVSGTYKTEYIKGDELDLSGIVLTVNYNKGDPKTIELKDVTVTGYDKTKLGDQQLTISYEGLTALITVNVKSDKKEITVTISVLGDSLHGAGGTVHTLVGGNLSTWIAPTEYTVDSNSTVWDVVKKCLDEKGYSYSNPTGNYIKEINGLAEFSNGTLSGWMYTLNGGHSSLGVSEQYLEDGDVIIVHYTDDWYIDDPVGTPPTAGGAAAVEKLIKDIGTVSLDSKSKIEAARKAYDALVYADKQKVSNYKTLTDAEAEFAKLKEADDKKKAEEVKTLITNIGKFDDNFEKRVKAARNAYDDLSDDQKELVDNYDLLVQAEKLLASKEDKEAAEQVEKLIKLIDKKVTINSKDKIELARKAYDLLTEKQKNLVDNYKDLVAAEKELARRIDLKEYEDIFKACKSYLEKLGTPNVGETGGEWMVVGLVRSGGKVDKGYYDNAVKFVQENIDENNRLHRAKSTENSRLILALTAMDKDVTDVVGHNLLTGLTDMDYLHKQGINGPIWALIAFDSGNYPVPAGNVSREALVDAILDAQLADGGWALAGEISDPDMTGMALTALAPYVKANKEVKKAVDEAVKALSIMQSADGGFSSIDGSNSESCAQVIVALSALGIDADTDNRFIKNGVSVLDALYSFAVEGGGFRHLPEGKLNGMATEQAYYALTAYFRMINGEKALYDMTDIIDKGGDKKLAKAEEPKPEKADEETQPVSTEMPEVSAPKRPGFWQWLKNLFS